MFGFQSLHVYKAALSFVPHAYALAKHGDGELSNQLRRAALSVSLNIAEGSGRFDRDQKRFYVTARASALECAAILDVLRALGTDDARIAEGHELLINVVRMLSAMIRG